MKGGLKTDIMFSFYGKINGVEWYQCRMCGFIVRGNPPPRCPVCHGIPKADTHEKEQDDDWI